ncbi:acyl-CoA dehydrogenase [Mycobacterium sp. GA-1841]|uniref:acyl-CoA dehydrogenase family protein n=1 Tax=Mycobacterium sp. GA-1841 TaxID=1834154 RepID=UPI00096C8059|nr:acyl-CoA dehydrogenase family protein [Mycobacterium sp. GA-1841]OMC40841.1 acyl-CoA dehydrogenase [Mycobacterium sp. GA-1841]
MLLELDDDQRLWRETVQQAVAKQCPASLVRSIAEGAADADGLWRWYCGEGWTELATTECFVELSLVLEELGRASDPTPFLATTTQFAPLVDHHFDASQSGAAVYMGVTARRNGMGWLLSGVARFVLDGDRAHRLAVLTEAGVFIVDAGRVTARRAAAFDPVLHVGDLLFDDVRVSDDDRIVTDTERAKQVALTGMATHTVGACQRILEMVIEHVKERHQFGVAIGSFQAIQHKVADMHVFVERARALSYFAALTIASADKRSRLAPFMAKAAAGEAQSHVVRHGMQCFGAMGLTWENDLQFAVKRARAGEVLLGGAAEHRAIIAKEYRAADF